MSHIIEPKGSSNSVGIFTLLTGTSSQTQIGYYANFIGSSNQTGYWVRLEGTGGDEQRGFFADVLGNTYSNSYGIRINVQASSTSDNFGSKVRVGNASADNYAYYAEVIGTKDFAFYSLNGNSFFNVNRGDYDFQVSTLNYANLFFVDGGNDRIGIGIATPTIDVHIDKGTSTASYIKFTAGTTTGQSATDGFDIGITSNGTAEIRQRENNEFILYTNNTESIRVKGITNSVIIGGAAATTGNYRTNTYGEFTFAPWQFFGGTAGTAEYSRYISGTQTTNNTVTEIFTNASSSTGGRMVIATGSVWGFSVDVVGYNITAGTTYYVRHRGSVRNLSGTVALQGSITTETIFSNFAAGSSASVDADNTAGVKSLRIRVNGVTGQTVRWLATTELYKLGFT